MKTSLTASLLLMAVQLFGQANFHADSSCNTLDSLFRELIILTNGIRQFDSDTPVPSQYYKSKVKNYGSDSSIIHFYNKSDELLFRKLNKYDENGCRWWEVAEIFNTSGKLKYREALKWSCIKPNEKVDIEVKYFEALVYERERFVYDSSGRVKKKVWWHAPLGDIRIYTYTYDLANNPTYELTKLAPNLFWE